MGDLLLGAANAGDAHAVVRLLSEGAKLKEDEGGRNALHVAATAGHIDIVAALIQARWDPNATDKQGCTALQRAAAGGHLLVVKHLIQHGAQVNSQDKAHGNTALHEASWRGWSKCVEALSRAKKANLDLKNLAGFAPLHLACQNGHNQSCRELLLAQANPDVRNNYGDTPLHTSARYGHAGVTRILISAECKVSEQNKNGDTALHITAAMGRRKLTRILLESGCDPNRRNKQGERAKDIAIRKDLNEIIGIMEKTVAIRRKREKGSGSSKDSGGRKEKKKSRKGHQEAAGNKPGEGWSPYGCHYFPDPHTFPQPRLDSLPQEPLRSGEQYFLDLAGNIRKGPVGVGYTCYCAPFFRHMEARLERDKRELKAHIDAAQGRLDRKVTSLEATTRGHLAALARGAALERAKCQQRHLHLEQWLLRGSVLKPVKPQRARSLDSVLEPPEIKQRSSSREGKESGKGSSEVVGPGSDSDGSPEEKLRRSTRAMSERIDEVLRTEDGADTMERLYGDLLQWRKHHREKKPQRESVQDIIAKFQKQQSVQELVAKIQRKTDKIHKSAQKWKERHSRHDSESSEEGEETSLDPALRRLPFRCRDTVYSPDPTYVQGSSTKKYSPDLVLTPSNPKSMYSADPIYGEEAPSSTPTSELRLRSNEELTVLRTNPHIYMANRISNLDTKSGLRIGSHNELPTLRTPIHFASAHDIMGPYGPSESSNSPQPDSGYSTKPWTSSPTPTGLELPESTRSAKPPVPVRKSIRPTTASLV